MDPNETIKSLERKLLEAYKAKSEAEDTIKVLTYGLQGVSLGRAAVAQEQSADASAKVDPAILNSDILRAP